MSSTRPDTRSPDPARPTVAPARTRTAPSTVRILGLDPGLGTIGFAVLDGTRAVDMQLVTCGCIRTRPGQPRGARLLEAYRDLTELVERHRPDVAVLEKLFFGRNVTTALDVGQMRGVLLLALAQAGLPIAEYTPAEVKKAVVGYGRGVKSQVKAMVARILRLAAPPSPDDAADAAAIAICHRFSMGFLDAARSGR